PAAALACTVFPYTTLFRSAAVPVGREDDAAAVRAEARLRVERHALRERRRSPAGHRHRVDVAEQIEDERLTVGTHVDRHPRAFRRRELDGARGGEGKSFLNRVARSARRVGGLLVLRGQRAGTQCDGQQREPPMAAGGYPAHGISSPREGLLSGACGLSTMCVVAGCG